MELLMQYTTMQDLISFGFVVLFGILISDWLFYMITMFINSVDKRESRFVHIIFILTGIVFSLIFYILCKK